MDQETTTPHSDALAASSDAPTRMDPLEVLAPLATTANPLAPIEGTIVPTVGAKWLAPAAIVGTTC